MTMTKLRRTAVVAATIAVLGALTGCGGDDAATEGESTDAADTSASPSSDPTSDDSTDGSGATDGGDTGGGAAFSGDVCTLGADVLTRVAGDSDVSATPNSPKALFMGQGCEWDGNEQRINVDVSSYNDFVPITDSLLYDPQPVPDLGPDAWVQPGGSTSDIAFRRDGVSVYVSAELSASAETLTEIATAIDKDLQAAGA